ncbi:MAG: flagellar basal body-associated FliL family protein [Solirubrobacterales bacterium]
MLAKPKPTPKPKVAGEVYVLPKEFLVNLADRRYAESSASAWSWRPTRTRPRPAKATARRPSPPEGYGSLPQEALVRDIVTDEITDVSAGELVSDKGRRELKRHILDKLRAETDVHADDVLFTDVTVQ